jgi:hypothetical protein
MLRATVGALAVAILATAPAFAAARWTVKWVFRMDGSVGSSPAVEVDGTVYVRSMDGNIYALLGSSGCGLQRGSPWPMFHGNAQHTGHAVPMLADGK